MTKCANELGLKIKGTRLLTREELMRYGDTIPYVSSGIAWWLADKDPVDECFIAYAEGNESDDDMFCERSEANTYVRVALDFEGDVEIGEEFIHCGYVFTALDENLAISNNFVGAAKYYDEEIAGFMMSDDEITCTIDGVLGNLFSC